MKTKLLSSSNSSAKSVIKGHNIFSFLFILLMTVSSFGQVTSISFEFCGAKVTFGQEDGRDSDGYPYWTDASVLYPSSTIPVPVTEGYTLYVEDDGGTPTWALRQPGDTTNGVFPDARYVPGPRYYKLKVFENSICGYITIDEVKTHNWEADTFTQSCTLVVTCNPTNDSDNDNDGYFASIDCNDFNDSIYPGALEVCDGIDNNCNGVIDEGMEGEGCFEWCGDVEKQNKVVMCHNGKDICVSVNAMDAHLAHGDELGSCISGKISNNVDEIIDEGPTTFDVAFWPNPSNNTFNVKMITPNGNEKVSIKAFDINGRLVHSNTINGNQNYKFGNNLSAGIYMVKLTQESTTKMIKLVKQ